MAQRSLASQELPAVMQKMARKEAEHKNSNRMEASRAKAAEEALTYILQSGLKFLKSGL